MLLVVIEEGGPTIFFRFALAASNNFLPSSANFFRSSVVSCFVPSFVLPCCTCFLIDERLPRDPSIESSELVLLVGGGGGGEC